MTGQMAASRTCEAYAQCVRQAQDRDHLRLFQLRTVTDKCAAVAAMCDLHLGHISPRARVAARLLQFGQRGNVENSTSSACVRVHAFESWTAPQRLPSSDTNSVRHSLGPIRTCP